MHSFPQDTIKTLKDGCRSSYTNFADTCFKVKIQSNCSETIYRVRLPNYHGNFIKQMKSYVFHWMLYCSTLPSSDGTLQSLLQSHEMSPGIFPWLITTLIKKTWKSWKLQITRLVLLPRTATRYLEHDHSCLVFTATGREELQQHLEGNPFRHFQGSRTSHQLLFRKRQRTRKLEHSNIRTYFLIGGGTFDGITI